MEQQGESDIQKYQKARQYAYYASRMSEEDTTILPDSRVMNKRELLMESLKIDFRAPGAYYVLGEIINNEETITLPDGRKMNKRQLFIEANKWYPGHSHALLSLADTLQENEIVILSDGRVMNKRQLYLEIQKMNPYFSKIYSKYASIIGDDEIVELTNGRKMNKKELLIFAVEKDTTGENIESLLDLANSMKEDEIVLILGLHFTKEQLYQKFSLFFQLTHQMSNAKS